MRANNDKIERAIERENWDTARQLIMDNLAAEPDNHWLLTRLSTTYYEQQQYEMALKFARKALQLAPSCPLVIWDVAGALDMLGQFDSAIEYYKQLTVQGITGLSEGEHREGRARGRGLYADAFYRMGLCYWKLGDRAAARQALSKSLSERGRGCNSIYPILEVRKAIDAVTASSKGARAQKDRPKQKVPA